MIVLYSNNCPRCQIVKNKLDDKKIDYKLVDDVEWLTSNGFDQMPVLEVDGNKLTSFIDMNNFINQQ